MESLETTSTCSELSDGAASNLSTVSGLSSYENEFLELRNLVNSEKYPELAKISTSRGENDKHKIIVRQLEERVIFLTNQLNGALKLNHKQKCEAYNVEKKTELRFNERIEQLVHDNNQLQSNLESANSQINRLITNYSLNKENSQISQLQNKILKLERSTHEANLNNSSLESEIFQCKRAKCDLELEHDHIKLELNDLRLEFSAKNHCINELKSKISEQHVEIQTGLRTNVKLANSLSALENELDCVKKSETWYKEQLHQSQIEKKTLIDEVKTLRKTAADQGDKIEDLKLELSKSTCDYEKKELEWFQDKKQILAALEDALKDNRSPLTQQEVVEYDKSRITSHYENTISDLRDEIDRIKINIDEQSSTAETFTKENCQLISKCANLQKELEFKEYKLERLESERKSLEIKLEIITDKENEIMILKNTISDLQIALNSKNRENEVVIESVRAIKEQFKAFKSNYEHLRSEIRKRDKEILKLRDEKQQLFMSNNWKTCELEKSKERDSEVQVLQQRLLVTAQNENRWKFEASRLKKDLDQRKSNESDVCEEVDRLKSLLDDKDRYCDDLRDDLSILKGEIHKKDEQIRNLNAFEYYINKMCKIDSDFNLEKFADDTNNSSRIQEVLNFISNQIYPKDATVATLKIAVRKLKFEVADRLQVLEKRIQDLDEKCEENSKLLLNLSNCERSGNVSDEIKHLQALVQVKMRELKEKQNKYEINYRTLLRKVKEHMKYRNSAEKHNIYLQDLYNTLSDKHNSLRLQLSSKEFEIQTCSNLLEDYRKTNERQKKSISSLEKQLSGLNNCEKCAEFQLILTKIDDLENLKSENAKSMEFYRNQIEEKDKQIVSSRIEINDLLEKLSNSDREIENYVKKLQKYNEITEELQTKVQNLERSLQFERDCNRDSIFKEKESNSKLVDAKHQLQMSILDFTDKNAYLSKELEILKSDNQLKCEELADLRRQKHQFESNSLQKSNEMQNLMVALKTQLRSFKHECESLKNEKFFLQRLSNDLKVALKVHVASNKALQEQLGGLCKQQDFSSLPTSLLLPDLPEPKKFDDDYINKLLLESKAPLREKPLSDIQVYLDKLKNEVSVLQRQVVEKNIFRPR